MMIYDFGLSKDISSPVKLRRYSNLLVRDYARIINAFLTKANGWGEYYDLPTKECEMKVRSMQQILMNIIYTNIKVNQTPKEMFYYILTNVLLPFAPADMFMRYKPNATIINSSPYKIG